MKRRAIQIVRSMTLQTGRVFLMSCVYPFQVKGFIQLLLERNLELKHHGEPMGNQDNWTTPKQIKIERAGEPRGTRRGSLKKGQRKKGKKARIDEILSAKKDAERYRQYVHDDEKRRVEHPEWYTPEPEARLRRYDPEYRKWFDKSKIELDKRIEKAIKDGVIDKETADYYKVELYPF